MLRYTGQKANKTVVKDGIIHTAILTYYCDTRYTLSVARDGETLIKSDMLALTAYDALRYADMWLNRWGYTT
jgi:hypothetical protein